MAPRDDFMTVAEEAEVLNLNEQTLRKWIGAGTLPAVRIGRRVRVRRSGAYEGVQTSGEPTPAHVGVIPVRVS